MGCIIFNRVASFCRKVLNIENSTRTTEDLTLQIIPRQEHGISRRDISENALKVLYRLNKAGFDAYLVGGGVRDILLGKQPKDFDIATNATPEEIKDLFRNCRLIGRRFRLAHILFGRDVIEVATFRGHHEDAKPAPQAGNNKKQQPVSAQNQEGMLLRDNVYGSIDEDAERRDFTVNALYYNIDDYSISDYTNGVQDLEDRIIRLIGDPETRYREDPVRMLRAARFAAKLDMTIEERTAAPIKELSTLLRDIPAARLFEESLKLLQSGQGFATYELLREYNLFQQLFPIQSEHFTEDKNSDTEKMIAYILKATDKRIAKDMRVNPAFMYAAMLWYPMTTRAEEISITSGLSYYDAFMVAANDILDEQVKTIAIPRRHTTTVRDIWQQQLRFTRRTGKRAFKAMEHPKFRAAYDFLEMRSNFEGDDVRELAQWWNDFQHGDNTNRNKMVQQINDGSGSRRPRRRKPQQRRRKPQAKPS
ncbi:polynucleotide adenylyltransferase PcnB [Photobacterium sanguinicancri]|uniref:Poly(A) polymerase I n=1 Tax=Photobacterium sanguinicancri TaxID=875932 RepID=A0AAW7Y6Z2_9GAMM|nr:polynucleotide adenylyltransferase PcnB [Photobacterium sanguinicancri]MDO6499670.1 polynucleotide adenylyltransferase PcnB [Photobacterium sanguinicancri]MDO6544119.1 polynucleotide adenylyltransferase PcnB [Photobacterium sanguinicancri]OZS44997.1 polynucleotide adenylyltransferase [Photobacterium sanguinicancri]